nr:VWA-like domain-containing protein [Thermincola ferriacetica]
MPAELQAARLRLVKDRPYLTSAAWALQPVAKPGLGTMAVDQFFRLYYDPAVTTRWTVEELSGVLYHEICHLLRDHASRMKEFDPRLSNIAADAEIDDDILREGVRLPAGAITPASIGQPNGLLAEEYYAALEKQAQQAAASQGASAQPGNESGTGVGEPEAGDGGASAGPDRDSASQVPAPGAGRCGSCATGQPEEWEEGPPGEGISPGISRAEAELIRRDVARQIREHVRACGNVPGHWARWADEKLRPKVDWRKELAAAVRHAVADVAGACDYSYRRPSRRQGQVGNGKVIFPSLRRPVPSVAVVVDTSGSVGDAMLAQALAEIAGILRSLGQREGVHVLAVDRAVQSCRRVFRPEQVRLAGGGGTDMGAGLEAAAKLRPCPQVAVVITDCLTPWPDQPPEGMKVIIVALTGDGKTPDWAKTIRIQ